MDAPKPKKKIKRDERGHFVPGNEGGGRTYGSKNKFTAIKMLLADIFNEVDGAKKLERMAKKDFKKFFYSGIHPLLPKEDSVELTTPEPLTIRIEDETKEGNFG